MSLIFVFMIIVGLAMCFGGLYFRKFIAGLMSFCWSLLLGTLFLVLALLSGNTEISTGIIIVGILVIACTIISVVYERICVAINSFISTFSILVIIFLFLSNFDEWIIWILLALICSFITARISYNFYYLAFIINSAFTGGLIASIGFYGLFSDFNASVFRGRIMSGDNDFLYLIFVGTLVLGCAGTFVQYQRLKKIQRVSSGSNNSFIMDNVASGGVGAVRRICSSELFLDLKAEKFCLLLCLIGFVIFPLANAQIVWDGPLFGIFVNKAYYIFERVAIAGVIYFAYNKKITSSIIYCMPFLIAHIIIMGGLPYYTSEILLLAEPFLILLFSVLLRKGLRTDFKYLCSILFVIFYRYFLLNWVDYHEIYWSITIFDIVQIIGLIVALTLLVYFRNKRNIWNIAFYVNQIAGKQTVTNKMVVIIAICIIVIISGGIFIKNQFVEKQEYDNSAAGQREKNEEFINESEQESSENEEMIATLTAESWEVYCVYNDVDEEVFLGDIYGFWMINRDANYLKFDHKGQFTLCLGDFTAGYDGGVMTGIYECEGNRIELYSDSSDTVLELEYTNLDYHGYDAMSLLWYDDITKSIYGDDNTEYYRVYFVNPSFYQ